MDIDLTIDENTISEIGILLKNGLLYVYKELINEIFYNFFDVTDTAHLILLIAIASLLFIIIILSVISCYLFICKK